MTGPLTTLMSLSYGVVPELELAFATVEGVEEAFVYGSWAARRLGKVGPEPHDIDVLVVGTADRTALFEAASTAETRLRREVNVHQISPQAWHAKSYDGFIATVKSRPTVPLHLPPGLHKELA